MTPSLRTASSDRQGSWRGTLTTGLMLFALFFGAGNLIFPPVLGASSGGHFSAVIVGFLATGVLLPLVSIVAVCTSGEGILGLARRVGPRFGTILPMAVYLSLGPFYAAPRVATVSYELATRPVLELAGAEPGHWALPAHCLAFFALTVWIAMRPSGLADKIGRWLTPMLLLLLTVLVTVTLATQPVVHREAVSAYASSPLTTGLTQGYLTMDVLGAVVFGIVVISSLREQGCQGQREVARSASIAGAVAAVLLAVVYVGLALVGTRTAGDDPSDGTALLRTVSQTSLGGTGVVIFAAIVVLACLTTAVGLLSSWAGYASTAWPRTSYRAQLLGGTAMAFLLANLGLEIILKIVSPLTLLLYPIAITLVVVTLIDVLAPGHLQATYLWPVACSCVLGAVSALSRVGWRAPSELLATTGMWDDNTGWMLPTLLVVAAALAVDVRAGRWSTPHSDMSGANQDVEKALRRGL